MDNQHKLITGYRDLTDAEIAAMNEVKEHSKDIGALVERLKQVPGLDPRWIAIAQTDLQKGFMSLTRAIAQPTTF